MGRRLKELGSIHAFNLDNENSNQRKLLQDRRVAYLYWKNFWIAVGTCVAAVYYSIEIIKHHASNLDLNVLTSLVIFLFGIGAGAIIILIAKELSSRKNKQ